MKTLTDQQKLEILCAYLPHGVEALVDTGNINPKKCKLAMVGCDHARGYFEYGWKSEYKLILRHPDDMTDEEIEKLSEITGATRYNLIAWIDGYEHLDVLKSDCYKALNYLHSIHIDTFNAIEAGFAVRKEVSNG